jgi:cytochrome c6
MTLAIAIVILPAASFAGDAAADTYATKCAACHAKDGSGQTAMGKKYNLKPLSSEEVQKKSDAELTTTITKGKDKMPSYDGKLTPDQIKGLVAYIRTFKK